MNFILSLSALLCISISLATCQIDFRLSREALSVLGYTIKTQRFKDLVEQRFNDEIEDQIRLDKYKAVKQNIFEAVTSTDMNISTADVNVSIPVTIYVPNNFTENSSIIIFFHGGGFVQSTRKTFAPAITHLSFITNAAFVSVEYRLAPENRFPIGLDDCKLVTEFFVHNKRLISPLAENASIGVMGDSAGANFASVIANELTDDKIDFQILLYGLFDLTTQPLTPSRKQFRSTLYLLTPSFFESLPNSYFVDKTTEVYSPRFNSIQGVTAKTPTTLMIVSELDPLRDDSLVLLQPILKSFNVTSEAYVIKGMIHGFLSTLDLCPIAFSQAADYIKSFLVKQ